MNVLDHPALAQGNLAAAEPEPGWRLRDAQTVPDPVLYVENEGYAPLTTGRDHELGQTEAGGVQYQRCGGGRRIIKKRIGGA